MLPAAEQEPSLQTASWLQTRAILRIILLLFAVTGLLWIIYRLTTVILLIVLAVFFAYLVAPLVDLMQRPIRIGGRQRVMPRGLAIGVVYLLLFVGGGLAIYFLAPQFGAQLWRCCRGAGCVGAATNFFRMLTAPSLLTFGRN